MIGVTTADPDWVIDQLVKIGREFSVEQLVFIDAIDKRYKGEGNTLAFAFEELPFLLGLPLGFPFGVAIAVSIPLPFAELLESSPFASLLFAFSFGKSASKLVA